MRKFILTLTMFALVLAGTVDFTHVEGDSLSNAEMAIHIEDIKDTPTSESVDCEITCSVPCMQHLLISQHSAEILETKHPSPIKLVEHSLIASDVNQLKRPPRA